MRKRLLRLTGIGLVAVLLLTGLPSAVLGQTVTPTAAPGVTATPLPTNTPRVTNTPVTAPTATPLPTNTPRATVAPTTAPLVVTVTPVASPTARPAVTVTPAELPITGHRSTANTVAGLLPVIALLLLAIPALGGLRARRR